MIINFRRSHILSYCSTFIMVIVFDAGCCSTTYNTAKPLNPQFDRTLLQIFTISDSENPVLEWQSIEP